MSEPISERPATHKTASAEAVIVSSPVMARLIEEIRVEKVENANAYNRQHNRHNR